MLRVRSVRRTARPLRGDAVEDPAEPPQVLLGRDVVGHRRRRGCAARGSGAGVAANARSGPAIRSDSGGSGPGWWTSATSRAMEPNT